MDLDTSLSTITRLSTTSSNMIGYDRFLPSFSPAVKSNYQVYQADVKVMTQQNLPRPNYFQWLGFTGRTDLTVIEEE